MFSQLFDQVTQRMIVGLAAREAKGRLSALEQQERLFQRLKKFYSGTQVAALTGICRFEKYVDYLHGLPTRDYEAFRPLFDDVRRGESGVLFPDSVRFLAKSSGTTSTVKTFAINESSLRVFLTYQKKLGASLARMCPGFNPLTADRLVYGARPLIPVQESGESSYPTGHVSGILAENSPRIFRGKSFPQSDVLKLSDWNAKLKLIAEESRSRDVQLLVGVPAYLVRIAEYLVKSLGISSLLEIWPRLCAVGYGGNMVSPHIRRLNELIGRPVHYFGTYMCSEGPLGFPTSEPDIYELCTAETLFSFRPVDAPDVSLGVHELDVGKRYLIDITNFGGLIKYSVGDVIAVKSLFPQLQFSVEGRQGLALDIAGERMSHRELVVAISELQERMQIHIDHFFIYPSRNAEGRPHYQFIFCTDSTFNLQQAAALLDDLLAQITNDYSCSRVRDEGVLDPVQVSIESRQLAETYFQTFREQGALKMKSVFRSREELARCVRTFAPGHPLAQWEDFSERERETSHLGLDSIPLDSVHSRSKSASGQAAAN